MVRFTNQVAIITGACIGLGPAMAMDTVNIP